MSWVESKNYSINELAEMFGQTEVEYIPARKGEYPFTLGDYTKANQSTRLDTNFGHKRLHK